MSGARGIIAQAFGLVHRNSSYPHASKDECEIAAGVIIGRLQFAGFRILGPDELDALEAEWTRPDAMRLRGGEMTPQEIRTAQAFVRGFVAELRTLTTGGKNAD